MKKLALLIFLTASTSTSLTARSYHTLLKIFKTHYFKTSAKKLINALKEANFAADAKAVESLQGKMNATFTACGCKPDPALYCRLITHFIDFNNELSAPGREALKEIAINDSLLANFTEQEVNTLMKKYFNNELSVFLQR